MLSQRLGVKDSAGDCLCIDELVNRLGLERFVNVSPSCLSQLSLYLHIFRQELRSAKENFQHTVKERWKNSFRPGDGVDCSVAPNQRCSEIKIIKHTVKAEWQLCRHVDFRIRPVLAALVTVDIP